MAWPRHRGGPVCPVRQPVHHRRGGLWYAYRIVLGVLTAAAGMRGDYLFLTWAPRLRRTRCLVGGVPGLSWDWRCSSGPRRLVVVFSAIFGAAVTVASAALVLTEGQQGLQNWVGPKLDVTPVAVLAGAVIALAAGGMRLQFRLPNLAQSG